MSDTSTPEHEPPPEGVDRIDELESPEERDPEQFFLFSCLFEGGLVFLAIGLGWIVGFSPVESFHWGWVDLMWGVLATGPMLVGFFLLDKLPFAPFARLREVVDRVVRPMMRPLGVFEFAAIALFAGIGEETLFRGLIQGWLSTEFDFAAAPWVALVVASLLFGAMHPITRTYAVLCAIMGVYFGLLWMWTGNLLAPIVAHALYDFVALVYLMKFTDEEPLTGKQEEVN